MKLFDTILGQFFVLFGQGLEVRPLRRIQEIHEIE